jgi:hypothetical protein
MAGFCDLSNVPLGSKKAKNFVTNRAVGSKVLFVCGLSVHRVWCSNI